MNTKYLIEEQTLKNIADSIRLMDNSSDEILTENYPSRILNLETTVQEYLYIMNQVEPWNLRRPSSEYTGYDLETTIELYNYLLKIEGVK